MDVTLGLIQHNYNPLPQPQTKYGTHLKTQVNTVGMLFYQKSLSMEQRRVSLPQPQGTTWGVT